MTNVAKKMRFIAEESEKKVPKEMDELYDQIVQGISSCAKKGLLGMTMTVDLPEELGDYCPHIVGDLRGGGFSIDVLSATALKNGYRLGLFITW